LRQLRRRFKNQGIDGCQQEHESPEDSMEGGTQRNLNEDLAKHFSSARFSLLFGSTLSDLIVDRMKEQNSQWNEECRDHRYYVQRTTFLE
jgi:hypothetical protein